MQETINIIHYKYIYNYIIHPRSNMNQARKLNEPPNNLHIKKLNYFCDRTLKN